ncbi:hypothetical protein Bca4012_090828 [Brassica carinata]|uniref:Uncharacterized protein n=2 Tax=Brassica TaxID=3705 RepID=A0A3P6FXX2_BRAOL|nr:unnamed protein product [Brassica napus]CDY37484.1 BnaC01g37480D [Brassica napus]VDD52644.1 unnamed protein product [Brassica oleracea]
MKVIVRQNRQHDGVSEGLKEWLEWPLEFVGYVETDSNRRALPPGLVYLLI